MTDPISRREAIKTLGVISAASVVPLGATAQTASAMHPAAAPEILPLTSTDDVFVPPRGRSFVKFSYSFPEPSVAFAGHRFGFMVFTDENTYAPDPSLMRAEGDENALTISASGFTWGGGQVKAPGSLRASFRRDGSAITWTIAVEMNRPIKAVTTIVRDVPRGQLSLAGGRPFDHHDDEILGGYTFGAGDLFEAAGMTTPIAIVQPASGDVFFASSLDDRVRPKRFYFQPGETAYRMELVYEHDAWRNDHRVEVPAWRIGKAPTFEDAMAPHMTHIERAFSLPAWETRADVPEWMRNVAMVTTLHGMHYTGYMFNDYAKMLEILRWMATQIPGDRVLVFISAWDGRYYWEYPNYRVSDRMGGEVGFRRLVNEAHRLGFKVMPMFGTNSANRKLPVWPQIAGAETRKIDGDTYYLNWVDWNNDRHQDGWATYMNLGADAWREWLESRIADIIERYGVDAYFLDIVGGHVNSTTGDMHEGTRRLVADLRRRFPRVLCVGEMPYDALYGFIPVYHAGGGERWHKYARFFQHLSSPAPGRGSTGVHEAGFGRFNPTTLNLSPNVIPTLQVVDDTFTAHRDEMAAIIREARKRAGI